MLGIKLGYFHGRFQPFHNGHLSVVKYALKKCDLFVLGISNPFRMPPVMDKTFSNNAIDSMNNARLPQNNPWPYWARILMIREGLHTEGLDLRKVIFIPNLNNTGLPVDEIRFPKEFTIVFVSPKDAHNHDIERLYRETGWEVGVVPNKGVKISSRYIRSKIVSNEPWEHLVPAGTAKVIRAYSSLITNKQKVSNFYHERKIQ